MLCLLFCHMYDTWEDRGLKHTCLDTAKVKPLELWWCRSDWMNISAVTQKRSSSTEEQPQVFSFCSYVFFKPQLDKYNNFLQDNLLDCRPRIALTYPQPIGTQCSAILSHALTRVTLSSGNACTNKCFISSSSSACSQCYHWSCFSMQLKTCLCLNTAVPI